MAGTMSRIQQEYEAACSKGENINTEEKEGLLASALNLLKHPVFALEMGSDYTEYQKLVSGKDYSNFDNTSTFARDLAAYKALNDAKEQFHVKELSLDNPEVKAWLEENALNPVIRSAIQKEAVKGYKDGAQIGSHTDNYREIDQYLSNYTFRKTLDTPDAVQRFQLKKSCPDKDVDAMIKDNQARQMVMAKTMFMANLGKFDLHNDGASEAVGYDGLVSEVMVHGGRTVFSLPPAKDSDAIFRQVLGSTFGDKDGIIMSRSAATHGLTNLRRDTITGAVINNADEQRIKFNVNTFRQNYGMNIAGGGLGTKVGNVLVDNEGRGGHMYIKAVPGDEKRTSNGLLMGIETSAPGKESFYGCMHDFHAKSAILSSFGANKQGIGKKIGGRHVDLSALSQDEFNMVMNAFDQHYRDLQQAAEEEIKNNIKGFSQDESARKKLQDFNKCISGERMNANQMKNFLHEELGFDIVRAQNLVEHARGNELKREAAAKAAPDPVRVDPRFAELADQLGAKDNKRWFGVNSKEMKEVKKALNNLINMEQSGKVYSQKEIKKNYEDLRNACANYLGGDKDKNNSRYALVSALEELTGNEYANLRTKTNVPKEKEKVNFSEMKNSSGSKKQVREKVKSAELSGSKNAKQAKDDQKKQNQKAEPGKAPGLKK